MPGLSAHPLPGQGVEPVPVGAAGVPAGLHQHDRRDLAQPLPLRGELGESDHPALHLGVVVLSPPLIRFPQPDASLNTTRAHPNARASIISWPGDGKRDSGTWQAHHHYTSLVSRLVYTGWHV